MRCSAVMERLDAFRTDELEERERRAVAAHMATCRPCADELAGVERLASECASLRVRAPKELLENVLARAGDRYGLVGTAIGDVWVGFNDRGVTLLRLGGDAAAFERAYESRLGRRLQAAEVPERYAHAVQTAAAGTGAAELPIDLSSMPAFEREVLLTLPRIPRGEVRSYTWLARETGRPRAMRAVGNALARNPAPLLLPCHRVVPATGGVGEYAFGSALKRALLENEGAPVEELEQLAEAGVRYLGCSSTRVYCLPSCGMIRLARPEHRVPFTSDRRAAAAGYRPCRRCRPVAIAA
jgi:O-6-methylguanine DNA methyltransferase